MVVRPGEGSEGQRPLTPSRTPGTPMKPRLARVGTSPSKRDQKPKEENMVKSSAKDVAELKDYVWPEPSTSGPPMWGWAYANGLFRIAIGRLLGKGSIWICIPCAELEHWRDSRGEADQAYRSP